MIRYCITIIYSLLLLLTSCIPHEDPPEEDEVYNLIEISSTRIIEIKYTKATIATDNISNSQQTITEHGHCWSEQHNPVVGESNASRLGLYHGGSFNTEINGLKYGTKYYVRSFIEVNGTLIYGPEISMETYSPSKPDVGETLIKSTTETTATIGGSVYTMNSDTIIQRGVCWNTTGDDPTLSDNIEPDDSVGLGNFECVVSSLVPKTLYYVRAYAMNDADSVGYDSTILHFRTRGVPSVKTMDTLYIDPSSIILSADVIDAGGGELTSRGVCWNTIGEPTIDLDSYSSLINATNDHEYTCQITGLAPSTYYYMRAFATNQYGIGYGEDMLVLTYSGIPELSGTEITQVQATTVECGGNVTSDGKSDILEKGVCWNTTGNPVISNDKVTALDNEIGSFSVSVTGLVHNTTYYFRTYATTIFGTGYGDEGMITTLSCNTFTDGDGGTDPDLGAFGSIIICDQEWMSESINRGFRIDDKNGPDDNNLVEKYCYGNEESNCEIYGGLYQWNEMMQYSTIEGDSGVCPSGYHVPTDSEWQHLVDNLGGADMAGIKLKESGTYHWQYPNDADNKSKFTALPGGYLTVDGDFVSINKGVCYWTSTDNGSADNAFYRVLFYNSSQVLRTFGSKSTACYVRCIRNK